MNGKSYKLVAFRRGYISALTPELVLLLTKAEISQEELAVLIGTSLIEALKLTDNIICLKGFIYADSNYRFVFVYKNLSEQEKTNVHRLTEKQFESGDYEPCQMCLT